jgi:hypothetical protein
MHCLAADFLLPLFMELRIGQCHILVIYLVKVGLKQLMYSILLRTSDRRVFMPLTIFRVVLSLEKL